MITVKVKIISVSADCPACSGTILDPDSGSHYINVNQYSPSQDFECGSCGKRFKLERKAWA